MAKMCTLGTFPIFDMSQLMSTLSRISPTITQNEYKIKYRQLIAARLFMKVRNDPEKIDYLKNHLTGVFNIEEGTAIEESQGTENRYFLLKTKNDQQFLNEDDMTKIFKAFVFLKSQFSPQNTIPIFQTDFSKVKFILVENKEIEKDLANNFEIQDEENIIPSILHINGHDENDQIFKIQNGITVSNSLCSKLLTLHNDICVINEFCSQFLIYKNKMNETQLEEITKNELSLLYSPGKVDFIYNYVEKQSKELKGPFLLTTFENSTVNLFLEAEVIYEIKRLQLNTPIKIQNYGGIGQPKYFEMVTLKNNNTLIWTYNNEKISIVEHVDKKNVICHVNNANGNEVLLTAVLKKNITTLKWLIEHGVDINGRYENKIHLIRAIVNRDFDAVKILIENGAKVAELEKYIFTPFALTSSLDIFKYLLENGMELSKIKIKNGSSLLHYALVSKKIHLFKLLATYKADMTKKKSICEAGMLEYSPLDGTTPLVLICRCADLEYIKIFVFHYDINNCKDENGNTILHLACQENNYKYIQYILKSCGVNINAVNKNIQTALHIAVTNSNIDVTKLLLHYGIDKDIISNDTNQTALDIVNAKTDINLKERLIKILNLEEKYVTPEDEVDQLEIGTHLSLIHNAVIENNTDDIPQLILMDANINCTNSILNTPLHLAASLGYTEMVKKLIEFDAKINISNADGLTPLHYAAREGHFEIVQILCDFGARVLSRTNMKQTARILAQHSGFFKVVGYLITKEVEEFMKRKEEEKNKTKDEKKEDEDEDFEIIDHVEVLDEQQ